MSSSSMLSPSTRRNSGLIPPQPGADPGNRALSLSRSPLRCSTGWPLGTLSGSGRPLAGYFAATWARTAGSSILATPWLVTLDIALEIWPEEISATTSFLLFSCSASLPVSGSFRLLLLLLSLLAKTLALSFSQSSITIPQSSLVTALNLEATCCLPALPPRVGRLSSP